MLPPSSQIHTLFIVIGMALAPVPQALSADDAAFHTLFTTSEQCIACHSNLLGPSGADVSIGYTWRASMMANSALDPYWQAGVRREIMDHPELQAAIEDKCSTCHMPMARTQAAARGDSGEIFSHLDGSFSYADETGMALDGVSCSVCHQIRNDNFGEHESFDGGYVIDVTTPEDERSIYGPYEIESGHQRIMQSASTFSPQAGTHIQDAELCATCHTLYTNAVDDAGNVVATFPEQMPYREWLHSDFRNEQSCQDCHMPQLEEPTPISSVLGTPREGFSQHVFRGGNAFMLRILNRYRGELGVKALPQELEATARLTEQHLRENTARVSIENASLAGQELVFDVSIENLTGHKLPTAYPSRRVWLHVTVADQSGDVIFESGAARPDGSITGNDNDADGGRYEPHYEQITAADQVQIYEPIMVDYADNVTTGLLYAVKYVKDNRLLPGGFDKTAADEDVAVHGAAGTDPRFVAGGDTVRYRIQTGDDHAAVSVNVRLEFQTIGYRWATNLAAYDAEATNRFVGYYRANAAYSAVTLTTADRLVTNP